MITDANFRDIQILHTSSRYVFLFDNLSKIKNPPLMFFFSPGYIKCQR